MALTSHPSNLSSAPSTAPYLSPPPLSPPLPSPLLPPPPLPLALPSPLLLFSLFPFLTTASCFCLLIFCLLFICLSFVCWFVCFFVHWFVCSFIVRSFVHSFIHSFIPSSPPPQRNILEPLLMKNNLFIADLTQYHISATLEGSSIAVDLDASSTQYSGCVVNMRPRGWVKEVNGSSKVRVHACV